MLKTRTGWWVLVAAMTLSVMAGRADAQPYVYALGWAPTPDITSTRLRVINTATHTSVAVIPLGRSQGMRPEDIAIAPDGALIYVVNSLDRTVSVVSTQTNTVVDTWTEALVGPNANSVAVSPDSRRVYVTGTEFINNSFRAFVAVVDIASRTRIGTIPIAFQFAYGLAAGPDGSRLYVVTGTSANAVAVVNTITNSVITTVALSGTGTAVTLSPDGRFAYLPRRPAQSGPGSVQVLDTASNTIVATTTVGSGPFHVGVSPNGAAVYAASAVSGQVHRLNSSTHAVEAPVAAPSALAVAFLPDSSRAYVAAGVNIFVMDTTTNAITATLPVPVSHGGTNIVAGAAAIVATPPPFNPPGSRPSNLRATAVSGNRVTLAWDPPTSVSPTGYVVEGGVAPGQVLGSLPTGSTATSFTFDAPTGVFYVRVHALTPTGRSGASNEIQIQVNLPLPPSAPANLLGLANGSELSLSWQTTSAGGPATSQILDVTGTVTLSLALPMGETFSFANVPPGTYTFRVRAVNIAGTSPPSPPVTLSFPNICAGPPQAPANFAASAAGSQLTVSWDPPAAGPAVSSYVLRVTGAFTLTLPLSERTISGSVPPGTYTLSVAAVNPCGSGTETLAQSVTVS